ncbi:ArsR/SmtB family transcription factor [Actinosynnema sp. ALI-1.44]|uniref:ArsR/SmtB family transcription factor n=1 Tax=Actinosynnema sp. ALI-1.44 TaxID=1933779 RepID=UPI00143DE95A|nr:winged helix-turn-helix domain-containing protein [Actinosynnema sp. ALI-1.44]
MRIRFTTKDLGRLQMAAGQSPVAESIFALDLLGRSGEAHGEWRKHVRRSLGSQPNRIHRLLTEQRPIPDLLWLIDRARAQQRKGHDERAARSIDDAVLDFCQVVVRPHWNSIRGALEAERDVRGRIGITNGMDHMLTTLHPRVRWNPPVLEIPGDPDTEIHLGGRGLLLYPAVFLAGRTVAVFLHTEQETGLPALVFPASAGPAFISAFSTAAEGNEQALGALVGHTRAAALQALTESCSTGELAQRLGISMAGASKHATVLREAGLVATTRSRNTAVHSLTQLGVALLQTQEPASVAPRSPISLAMRRLSAQNRVEIRKCV